MKLSKSVKIAVLLFPVLFFIILYGVGFLAWGVARIMAGCCCREYLLQESLWGLSFGLQTLALSLSLCLALIWMILLPFYGKISWQKRLGGFCGYLAFAILCSFGLPFSSNIDAREKARRISCSSNLRQFHAGLQSYEAEFGALPPDLPTLYRSRHGKGLADCRCPGRVGHSGGTDYEYYGHGRSLKGKLFVLMEDRADSHRADYRNILFSNGRVIGGHGPGHQRQ